MAERVNVEEWALEKGDEQLAEVLLAVARAATLIAKKIRVAGLADLYGAAGATNVQGEQQQKLDVYANDVMIAELKTCKSVAGLVSEEDDEPVSFAGESGHEDARFVVSFDPLDGSSNIDVNVNVGTIFGIREGKQERGDVDSLHAIVLQPGRSQVAAGYVVYGPSVVMVIVAGSSGVTAFTLDGSDEFVLSSENMRMPEQGPYYSTNEANAAGWPPAYRTYLASLLKGDLGGKAYSARYIGSLVADFHRTLLKGGVFLYPPTDKAPQGKLRLQYEGNPLAMVAEAAGGAAVDGKQPILDVVAKEIHGRTPLIVGSRREVEALRKYIGETEK